MGTSSPRRILALPLVALVVLAAACGERGPESSRVLARIDGTPVTEADVDARIERIPALSRPEFSGPVGRERMLRRMIEEEILHRAAVDAKIADREDVAAALEESRRRILVQAYLDAEREKAAAVSDDELRAFYDEHRDEYRTERMLRVRVFQNSRRIVAERAREMVAQGLPFEEVCQRHSEDANLVEARGLLPDWVRRDKAVVWLGNHPAFHEAAFGVEPGTLSGLFETPLGFHFLRVEDVREERQRPLEEVRDDVTARIVRERTTKGLPELLAELERRYRVERLAAPGLSAEELFAQAQAAADPSERVRLFEELLARHPDDERAVEAIFMIGFTRAEELGDAAGAEEAFRRVIEEYPDSELAESARWMIDSAADAVPDFEDEPAASADDQPGEGSR